VVFQGELTIAKAILYVILTVIQLASGTLQTYGGHDTGPAKAAILP